MSLWVDVKYANMVSSRLPLCKRRGDHLWNFRCVVCGDSKTNKSKARGYIYKVKTGLFVKCHNCSYGATIGGFLKDVDPNLHQQYVVENYQENGGGARQSRKQTIPEILLQRPTLIVDSVLDPIKRLDQIRPDHPAVKYVETRKIPRDQFSLLYFAPKFKQFVNGIIPNKFGAVVEEHPRLIIPYFNSHGKCFAFQGRAFGKEQPKYYTIKIDETEERIFGIDRVDFSRRVYITEGPLDSLFLPNAIAVSGSSFNTPTIEQLKTNATLVYDNEPRSRELTKLIAKSIEQHFAVCLWPDTVPYKDINEMVINGMSPQQILDIINHNTYSGAEAQLRFAAWRKCNG